MPMSDYLSAGTPDVGTTLNIAPTADFDENEKILGQSVKKFHGISEERKTLNGKTIFEVSISWPVISSSNAATIFDIYCDTSKGDGIAKTFTWVHPFDSSNYVASFIKPPVRAWTNADYVSITGVVLKVENYIA